MSKTKITIILVLTMLFSSSCASPYKSKLGDVFKRSVKENDWSNVPDYIKHNIKKAQRSPEEIIKAYIYIVEHEPDPTVRPQVQLEGGKNASHFYQFHWLGVCSSSHPYHRARCNQRTGKIYSLPNKILFPKTEMEITEAERYLQEMGDKSVESVMRFRSGTDRLVPPEFDRSSGRWLDVCHPNHKHFESSCHILREKYAIEESNKCISKGLVRLNEEYQNPSGFSITQLPILGPLIAATGVSGTDLEKAAFRAEVNRLNQACRHRNWNPGKRYLGHLTTNQVRNEPLENLSMKEWIIKSRKGRVEEYNRKMCELGIRSYCQK